MLRVDSISMELLEDEGVVFAGGEAFVDSGGSISDTGNMAEYLHNQRLTLHLSHSLIVPSFAPNACNGYNSSKSV